MKTIFKYLLVISIVILSEYCYSQTDTEFWFVKPNITQEHTNETFKIVFTTREFAADIRIEMPAEPTFTPVTFSVPAFTTYTYTVTQPSATFTLMENSTVVDELSVAPASQDNIGNKAILVTSTAPINAYLTQIANNNSDIYALKGDNGLGTEFIIPFQEHGYNQHPDYDERAFSSIDIISFEDGTVVEIIPPTGRSVYRGFGNPNETNSFTVTLNRGQVYTSPPGWDPTVTRNGVANSGWFAIDGNKRLGGIIVKVISGNGVAVVKKDDSVRKYTDGGWDEIADQWVPYKGVVGLDNDILGNEYVAMRGGLNNGWEWVYVAAPENNTRIWWGNVADIDTIANPVPDAIIQRGQQTGIQFNSGVYSNNMLQILSNNPLSVLHVSGVGKEMGGAVLPPIDKCTGSTSVSFARDINWPLYINIMARAGHEGAFLVDGVVRNDIIVPGDFVPVGSTGEWVAAQVYYTGAQTADFNAGDVHTISNTEDVFHIGLINGNSSGGCRFGYFSDFNELRVSANTIQGDGAQPSSAIRACAGDTVQLFASGGSVFNWWPTTNLSDNTISNPTAVVDGFRTYYVEVSGACDKRDTATVTIEMAAQPFANFLTEKGAGCAPLDIEFWNLSNDVNQIYWNFNATNIGGVLDRDTIKFDPSVTKDVDSVFTHTFFNTSYEPIDTPQTYRVSLKVKSTKCVDTVSTNITVYPEVTAGFTLSDLDDTLSCNPVEVDFLGAVLSENEDVYKWDFGDGALSPDGDPTHEYNNILLDDDTTYTAQLVVRSQWFCRDTAWMDFVVHPYLEGGFTIDEDEDCSPFTVKFTNMSSGADTIFLDFGDGTDTVMTSFTTLNKLYINDGTVDKIDTNIVVMRVKNDEGCEFVDYDTIIVYPQVHARYNITDAGGVYTGCNSRTVAFANTSNYGTHMASQFLWTFDDGTSSNSAAVNINHLYNNVSAIDRNYNFTLRAESDYGCFDDTSNTITIYRAFADYSVDVTEDCSPVTVNITNKSKGSNLTYDWDFDSPLPNSALPDPTDPTYTNTTPGINVHNLTLILTGNGGCSTSKTTPITVYPEIHVSIAPLNQVGCDSTVINFTSSIVHAALPNVTYNWNFGDGTSSNSPNPTHVYRNTTSASDTVFNVRLDVVTENGCSDFAETTVTIRPYVNAKFTADKIAGCSPLTVNAVATQYVGIPAGNYQWTYGDGYNPTMIDPPAHPYPANPPGTNNVYTLRLDVSDPSGTCTDFATKTITVYDESAASFTPLNAIDCNEHKVQFNSTASQNAVIYKWDFGDLTTSSDPNPEHTFTNSSSASNATYNVELEVTSDEGCVSTFNSDVHVYSLVVADFDIDVSADCSPLTVNITNNSSATEYYWFWDDDDLTLTNADSNSPNPISHTYTYDGGGTRTDYLTLIVGNGNGCYDTLKREIKTHSSIDAHFTFSQPDSCTTSLVTFNSGTTVPAASKYSWNFGDGTFLTTTSATVANRPFTNILTNDRLFPVTLTAETANGCTDTYTENVKVYSRLMANFSIPLAASCPPFENAEIENTSIGNNSNTYEWFVDGVSESTVVGKSSFIRTYDNTDPFIKDYSIRLLATNEHGCTSEKIDTISVYERVIAQFNMDTDEGCTPLLVNFDNQSQKTTETKYLWNYGDGATSSSFEPTLGHSFYNTSRETDKPYTIGLTVTSENYCSHDTTESIMVYHQPLAKFFIDKTSSCPPLLSSLDKTESLGETQWEWRFGDGSANNTTDNILTHEYSSTGLGVVDNYELELWVATNEGCVDSSSLKLNVFPSVTADFNFSAPTYCSPIEVNFTDNSSAWVKNYQWRFDDGNNSNLQNPMNRYENTGIEDRIYNVYLRVASEYNCWDTISKPITIFVQPNANFYVNPVLLKYPQNVVNLTNNTNFGPFNYSWKFGDLNSSTSALEEPGSFEYGYWGEKVIELYVESQTNADCNDYYSDTILIMPPEVNAEFTTNIDRGCLNNGLYVEFTAAQSVFNETYIYEWDFGDGSDIEYGRIVEHIYTEPGVFNVQLTAKSQEAGIGEDYEYKTIRVYANPEVNFEVSPKVAMLDAQTMEARVKFYNMSNCNDTAGCAYTWSFGDGETSISKDVTHAYKPDPDDIPIKYDIMLLAVTSSGCRDSLTLQEEIEIIGAGTIAFPNAFTPDGVGPTENETFRPVSEGVIEYELYIYNRWGELIFKTKDLGVGWDGNIGGDFAKPDVYVWKAKGKFTNGKAFELAGDVTLIR